MLLVLEVILETLPTIIGVVKLLPPGLLISALNVCVDANAGGVVDTVKDRVALAPEQYALAGKTGASVFRVIVCAFEEYMQHSSTGIVAHSL